MPPKGHFLFGLSQIKLSLTSWREQWAGYWPLLSWWVKNLRCHKISIDDLWEHPSRRQGLLGFFINVDASAWSASVSRKQWRWSVPNTVLQICIEIFWFLWQNPRDFENGPLTLVFFCNWPSFFKRDLFEQQRVVWLLLFVVCCHFGIPLQ